MTMSQPMKVLTSHVTVDWYTPPAIIELVREVLGEIGLDPASAEVPQQWIKATRYFCSGGEYEDWKAPTVFCNPPYGKTALGSNQAFWSWRMVNQFKLGFFQQGVLLINSTHGYKWYEELWTRYPVCLARERIRFVKPDGTVGGQAKRGQTFVYFGQSPLQFVHAFKRLGRVLLP